MTSPSLLPEGLRDRLPPEAEALQRGSGARCSIRPSSTAMTASSRRSPSSRTALARPAQVGAVAATWCASSIRSRSARWRSGPTSPRRSAASPRRGWATGRARLRLCYAGQVLKLRGTQLRPERELCQVGAELIGTDSVAAAIEVVRRRGRCARGRRRDRAFRSTSRCPISSPLLAAGPMPVDATSRRCADELDGKDAGALAALGASAYLPLIEAAGPVEAAIARLARARRRRRARLAARRRCARSPRAIGDRATLTLDPTERHGFEYQSWIGFSIFADGVRGEVGRGGSYTIVHAGRARRSPRSASRSISIRSSTPVLAPEAARPRCSCRSAPTRRPRATLRAPKAVPPSPRSADADDASALGCTHMLAAGNARRNR